LVAPVSAADGDTHLARGIPAQDGPVLNERDLCSLAGSSYCRRQPGHAAAHNADVRDHFVHDVSSPFMLCLFAFRG
jgi:hypothetical protein